MSCILEGLSDMITFMTGDIFQGEHEVLVNDINCAGKMDIGMGIILKDKYPNMFRQYEKLCADLPNKAVMKFLTKDELQRLFGMADIYVHASDAEIEAMGCMEAFASGLVPIIANSERSATPQFALDDRSLFRPGDSTDLAAKIDWWIEHEDERKRMEKAYAAEADDYRLDKCVARMVEMFRDEMARVRGL